MDLKVLSINEQGDASKEYVWIEVLSDCSLNNYALADTTYYDDGSISNELRHFYWFPNTNVRRGERVSLRTGNGKNTTVVNDKGQTVHRFYWGLGRAIWNDSGDAAVLFNIVDWNTTRA